FASLQIQNSPFRLRHWVCGRFASLRMVTKNSLMFAPGISATTRFFITPEMQDINKKHAGFPEFLGETAVVGCNVLKK
ncbi:MAG: hypothetical protein ACETWT_13930, partial [Thermodesulfobacteriota bacterium]